MSKRHPIPVTFAILREAYFCAKCNAEDNGGTVREWWAGCLAAEIRYRAGQRGKAGKRRAKATAR